MDDIAYAHLERAADAFARHDEAQTLAELLAAWRACHSPALVRICDEVERRSVAMRIAVDADAGPLRPVPCARRSLGA
ncbi:MULTISPECIES: hypothetical protein [Myxococcus]|uniref:hypothetical protein n=1 Tax=Myxococcus TaxID=32 RepID=UPI0013D8482D|nr:MULTISPECIES: hypothetical protein [Myxococcus]NVJ23397.1 hypothetical protein [Myxococcus sp. AM011]